MNLQNRLLSVFLLLVAALVLSALWGCAELRPLASKFEIDLPDSSLTTTNSTNVVFDTTLIPNP